MVVFGLPPQTLLKTVHLFHAPGSKRRKAHNPTVTAFSVESGAYGGNAARSRDEDENADERRGVAAAGGGKVNGNSEKEMGLTQGRFRHSQNGSV